MIKKMNFTVIVFLSIVSMVRAGLMTWGYGGDLGTTDFTNGWAVLLYEDVGVNGFGVGGTIGVDDVYTGLSTNLSYSVIFGMAYNRNVTLPAGGVDFGGDSIYTVIYDNADYTAASRYIIVDASPFTTPATDQNFNYVRNTLGGNTWQAVPEPTTIALFGLGLGTVALARKRRANKKA